MGTHDVATKQRVCTPRLLTRDIARPHVATVGVSGRLQAVAPVNRQWPAGTVLSVAFIGGSPQERDLVRAIVPQWEARCGIKFDWRTSLPATIRVSFDPSDGAWSYVGTDNAEIPANQPTLNLGWVEQDVILHEFGHALSLAHEHQNPKGGIRWNEAEVIRDLSGPPNYWDEETIRHNVLDHLALDQVHATEFDAQSIMLYSFPASWTLDGFSAPWNQSISAKDAELALKFYPREVAPTRQKLKLLLAQRSRIGVAAEVDEYTFEAPTAGEYHFQTGGSTDCVLSVLQGDKLKGQDDDGGGNHQAHVRVTLQPGTYTVRVRHYSKAGTGSYAVIAWA